MRKSDLNTLGDQAPDGPILAVAVEDLGEREAVLAGHPGICFTIPHVNGYPAVLVLLDPVDREMLGFRGYGVATPTALPHESPAPRDGPQRGADRLR